MLVQWIGIAWGVSEVIFALLKRADHKDASGRDRGSLPLLWVGIIGSIGAAIWLRRYALAPIALPYPTIAAVAIALMVAGMIVRVAAILTLKRSFTVDVAVRPDQTIVQHGLYRHLRHPSYSGALLSFYGLGFAFADWLSFAVIAIVTTLVFAYRIAVEERALREAFGAQYVEYAARTKRLLPGVY